MRRRSQLAQAGLLLLHLAQLAAGVEVKLTQSDPQQCSGMYSRKSWGGNIDPFILTKFLKPVGGAEEGTDTVVSLLVFEWKDRDLVATGPDGEAMVCDQAGVEAGRCGDDQLGEFVLADGAEERSNNEILTQAISLANPPAVRYAVRKTGYYCVVTSPFGGGDDQYTAVVEFRNAFGELPAAQIAKLPFYAALTIIYAFLALAWAALHYRHRADMLPVQHYVAAILGFLVLEMFTTWLFYDYQNRHGLTAGAKALLGLVSVLSAARNSFSFFLLLIVCMGYGVVRPSLGRTMVYVRALALTHFAFGVIYAIASLSVAPEKAGPLILLVVLPLAATLTAFYVWTLNALGATMKDLTQRRQTVKAAMYRKLWWCILASILVIFVFFFINSWAFAGTRQEDFVPAHWPTRWFILDGWLNLVYFFDVAFVAYLWRPTANNRRFAMSDEIAQDDDGFEIASLGGDSFDLDLEDPEADGGIHSNAGGVPPTSSKPVAPPAYDASSQSGTAARRDVSPLPAPKPTKPHASLPRGSLDGETLFALEEEEKEDSEAEDGDGEAGERERLTGGKD